MENMVGSNGVSFTNNYWEKVSERVTYENAYIHKTRN